jgi:multiple sugar transport system ATP-binding protein
MNFISGDLARQRAATTIGVRPEHLKVDREGQGWQGTVMVAEHLGSDTFLYVDAGPVGTLTARYIGELPLSAGDKVSLSPESGRIHRFDDSGNAIPA